MGKLEIVGYLCIQLLPGYSARDADCYTVLGGQQLSVANAAIGVVADVEVKERMKQCGVGALCHQTARIVSQIGFPFLELVVVLEYKVVEA